jgi:sucrose phosphorylase
MPKTPTSEAMTQSTTRYEYCAMRVRSLLEKLYPSDRIDAILSAIFKLIDARFADSVAENLYKWSEKDVILITYGDSIRDRDAEKPLTTLKQFLDTYLQDAISGVHILPFYPYSSDDGFAVIDYLQVNPTLGDWQDVAAIAQDYDLMIDVVLNHISSQHQWFEQFQQGIEPGCNYFIEVDPQQNLSHVVRPRSSPLLAPVATATGKKYVWATFSHDQIDVNFANPDVLLEFLDIILFYIDQGAKYLRLDAVGYVWKKIETSCIHLPETHALIKLLREILQMVNPNVAIITETNVPNRENLSYLGNRDEAHLIYNFSLPPLLLNALLQGKSDHLKTWMMSMPPAPMGCAYFNFTASHDGIGLRPAEGLLAAEEYQILLQRMQEFGGKISMRRQTDGTESPYELNISFFDAMKGTAQGEDEWQIERFLCSQTIMMSLEGIPAVYIHSFLATPNDQAGVEKTHHNRSINRHQWDAVELAQKLSDARSPHAIVLKELSRRFSIRRRQPAFHPNATQYTLHPLNTAIFAFWRQSMMRDQSIFCINNLSDRVQTLHLTDLNLSITDTCESELVRVQYLHHITDIG